MQMLHFMRLLVCPGSQGTEEKKILISAVGSDLFSRLWRGSPMSSITMIELLVGTRDSS